MNGEADRTAYGLILEEAFTRRQLAELEAALAIDGAKDGKTASIRRILAALDEPGALEKALRAAGGGAFELLIKLVDIGPILAIQSLRQNFLGIELAELTAALERLRGFALVAIGPTAYADLLIIQPWVRRLLDGALAAFRAERLRRAAPAAEAALPLQTFLALAFNALRAKPIRITNRDSFHLRDLAIGEAPFAALESQGLENPLARALKMLLRLEAVRIDAGNRLRIEPGPAEEILLAPADALAARIITRPGSMSRLEACLLELLRSRSGELPEGWTPDFHLHAGGELFGIQSFHGGGPDRGIIAQEALLNLHALGLAERCQHQDGVWWRITGTGRDLLAEVDGAFQASGPEPDSGPIPEDHQAIVQPNLDILVPLEAPGIVHWRIGSIARLESADHLCRYVIDKEHARETFSREGRDAERDLAAIAGCARHGLPENILATLRSWVAGIPAVRIFQGTVLVLEDRDSGPGRSALAEAARKLKATEAAPGIFVVRGEARPGRLQALLHRSGLRVRDAVDDLPGPMPGTGAGGEGARERAIAALRSEREAWKRRLGEVLASTEAFTLNELSRFQERLDDPSRDQSALEIEFVDDHAGVQDALHLGHESAELASLIDVAARSRKVADVVVRRHGEERTWNLLPERIVRRGSRLYFTGCRPDTGEYHAFPLDEIVKVQFPCL